MKCFLEPIQERLRYLKENCVYEHHTLFVHSHSDLTSIPGREIRTLMGMSVVELPSVIPKGECMIMPDIMLRRPVEMMQ